MSNYPPLQLIFIFIAFEDHQISCSIVSFLGHKYPSVICGLIWAQTCSFGNCSTNFQELHTHLYIACSLKLNLECSSLSSRAISSVLQYFYLSLSPLLLSLYSSGLIDRLPLTLSWYFTPPCYSSSCWSMLVFRNVATYPWLSSVHC